MVLRKFQAMRWYEKEREQEEWKKKRVSETEEMENKAMQQVGCVYDTGGGWSWEHHSQHTAQLCIMSECRVLPGKAYAFINSMSHINEAKAGGIHKNW